MSFLYRRVTNEAQTLFSLLPFVFLLNVACPSSSRLSALASQKCEITAQIRAAQRASNRKHKRREMCDFTRIELRFVLR